MRKRSSIAVLDFEGAALHVVTAANGRVTRATRIDLDLANEKREDAAAVAGALKSAVEKEKLKGKEVILAVPRSQVVLRPLQVPLVQDLQELAAVVNFQIAKDLPFRVEDAVIDFKVLRAIEVAQPAESNEPAGSERRLEVLVGALKKSVVEFYRAVARDAGLKLEGIGMRDLGNARFARTAWKGEAGTSALIVALRGDESTIDVLEGEKLVFSKVAAAPFPADESGKAAFVQALQIEAVRGLHSYGGVISNVFVLGGTGLEEAVLQGISAKLQLPAEILRVPETEDQGSAAACGLALAALEPAGLLLDFENPKRPPVQRNTKRTQLLVAIAAAFVLLFALVAVRMHLVKKRQAIRQQAQTELAEAEKKMPIYKRLKAQQKVVNGWMSEEQNWLDHLAYLSGVLPGADQIYISAYTTTPQHVIRFAVQAKTGELLAELDKKLRGAGYEVKPLSITPANDKHGYSFRTTVELTIPKKMKPDFAKVKVPPRPADDSPAQAGVTTRAGGKRS